MSDESYAGSGAASIKLIIGSMGVVTCCISNLLFGKKKTFHQNKKCFVRNNNGEAAIINAHEADLI